MINIKYIVDLKQITPSIIDEIIMGESRKVFEFAWVYKDQVQAQNIIYSVFDKYSLNDYKIVQNIIYMAIKNNIKDLSSKDLFYNGLKTMINEEVEEKFIEKINKYYVIQLYIKTIAEKVIKKFSGNIKLEVQNLIIKELLNVNINN